MFAPAFAPFANPEAIVNSKLVLAFLAAGWEVDIVSRNFAGESAYNYGSGWTDPWLPLLEITHTVEYPAGRRALQFADALWGGLRTGHFIGGCRWAAHAYDIGLRLHRHKPYAVIMSRSSPDAAHLPAMVLGRKERLPWIANWNDASGSKNLSPYGNGPDDDLGYFYDRFHSNVVKRADWHTFPSERLRKYMCSYLKHGIEDKSSAVPHVAVKIDTANKRQKKRVFTLCHAGHISLQRNPENFLRGVSEFCKRKGSRDFFRLIFVGLDDSGVKRLAERFNLEDNIEVPGPLSYKETLSCLAASDVLLVLEALSVEGIYLPAKFVDYVQTGRPILAITPHPGVLKDILVSRGGGIAADCHSPEAIADALADLYRCWEDNTLDEKYGSNKLYQVFSPETIVATFRNIFSHIGVKPF